MVTKEELDKQRIKYYSNTGMPLEEIISREVKSWLDKKNYKRNIMIESDNYYKNKGTNVEKKQRIFLGENGVPITFNDDIRKNNILKHNIFRKLVDQKVDYLLSKGVKGTVENKLLQKELDNYLTNAFHKRLSNTGREAVKKGIAWWQIYYNDESELKYKRIPSEEIIPLWADSEHDKLDGVIRVYEIEVYEGTEKVIKTKVEYTNLDGVHRWEYKEGTLEEDVNLGSTSHFTMTTEESELEFNWDKVPFVYFKYNDEENPLLTEVKSLSDDYDYKRSEFSDVLSDAIRSILVVMGYEGQSLGEFNEGIHRHFAANVAVDGDLKSLNVDINTEAHTEHISQLRRDIYELGRGVDMDTDKFGNSPSGVALKILYNDLDMDCNSFMTEVKSSLDYFVYFVMADIFNKTKIEPEEVTWTFQKNMLANDKDLIDTLENSSLSEQTKIENNPYAAADELDRIEKERTEILVNEFNYPSLRKVDDLDEKE